MSFIFIIILVVLSDFYLWKLIHQIRSIQSDISFLDKSLKALLYIHLVSSSLFVFALVLGGIFQHYIKSPEILHHYHNFFGIFMTIYACKILFSSLGYLGHFIKTKHIGIYHTIGLVLGLFLSCCVMYGITEGRTKFEVKYIDLEIEDLPQSFDGIKIVHISDLHLGCWGKNYNALQPAFDIISSLNADMMVLTGDIVNNFQEELSPYIERMRKWEFPLCKYFVSGNHDYSLYSKLMDDNEKRINRQSIIDQINNAGFNVIDNDYSTIRLGKDSLFVVGVGNYSNKDSLKMHAKLKSTMDKGHFQKEDCVILLSHNPSLFKDSVSFYPQIDLTLSGHTHGGQVGINIGNFFLSPAMISDKSWKGLYHNKQGQILYTNCGLGTIGYLGRLGAWPEITLITLTKSHK